MQITMQPIEAKDEKTTAGNAKKPTSVDSLIIDDVIVQLKQLLSGGLSGFCTRFITQPMDVIKIRFQLQLEPLTKRNLTSSTSKYTSVTQALWVIYKEEGVRGLWRGHNAGQVMTITYNMTQFWAYERFVQPVKRMPYLEHHEYLAKFVAGGAAGVVGSFVSLPFDVVRTRLVAQDPGAGYKSMPSGLLTLVRTEGFRGCFRGCVPTMVQIVPMMGFNFMFYDMFQKFCRRVLQQPKGHLPTWVNLLCGAVAGGIAKTISYPFDFLKKRMQIQGFESHRTVFGRNQGCTGILSCIKMTVREEGVLGFYKGLAPTVLKASVSAALFFGLYDFFKNLMSI